jgi:hypothetical protein
MISVSVPGGGTQWKTVDSTSDWLKGKFIADPRANEHFTKAEMMEKNLVGIYEPNEGNDAAEKTYYCDECEFPIVITGSKVSDFPGKGEKVLCQKCDPGFASLRDNKHHKV